LINKEKAGVGEATKEITDAAIRIFGLKNEAAVEKKFIDDAIEIDLGTFTNAIGVEVPLKFTRAELRKRVMELFDPSLTDKFVNDMRYTEDIVAAIRSQLTPQDEEFIAWQLDFYKKYYEGVNEVYREMTGTNLPFNQFYSPIAAEGFEGKQDEGADISSGFLHDTMFRAGVKSGSETAKRYNSPARSHCRDGTL